MKRALVTGANGFIGAHVVRAALDAGVEVRALVRPNSDQRNLDGLPIEIAHGDLTDPDSLHRALVGIDTLFHIAARYDLSRRARRDAYRANVDGTLDLMHAALRAQVERVVHTSSVAAIGPPRPPAGLADESQWASVDRAPGPYEETKIISERLVHDLVASESLPAVAVLPTAPIGPLDLKPTPTGRLIRDAATGSMPAYIRSAGLNVVHVGDVAVGHINAATMGRVGERYILGHQEGNLTLQQIIERAAAAAGAQPPRLAIPSPVAYIAALVDEYLVSSLTRQRPRATIAGVRLARQRQFFNPRKAIDELNLPQTDLDADVYRGGQRVSYTHRMNQHTQPQTVLITGANSGIGQAAATELARRGWHVFAAARSPERGQAAVSQIQKDSGSIAVELLELDLASFASVRRAADELLERTERLDVLVNNAGLTLNDRQLTVDGLETMMQTNHFSHVLLTSLLLPNLLQSDDARVVNVSSRVYERVEAMPLDDLNFEHRWGGIWPYCVTKLANILFANELHRRAHDRGLAAFSVHPGVVATNFLQNFPAIPCGRSSASRDHCCAVPSRARRQSSSSPLTRPDAPTPAPTSIATPARSRNRTQVIRKLPNASGSYPMRSPERSGQPHDNLQPRRTDCRAARRQRGIPGSCHPTAR